MAVSLTLITGIIGRSGVLRHRLDLQVVGMTAGTAFFRDSLGIVRLKGLLTNSSEARFRIIRRDDTKLLGRRPITLGRLEHDLAFRER